MLGVWGQFEINVATKGKWVEREVSSCWNCAQPWACTPGNGEKAAVQTEGRG